jgi:uncharacterized protein YkwD
MRLLNLIIWGLIIVEIGWLWKNKIYQTEIKNIPKTEIDLNLDNKIETEVIITKIPTLITPTPIKKIIRVTSTPDNEPWGVAKQIDELTWTMKVGEDEKMATAQEIFSALNIYRQRYGSQNLNWDSKLGDYAQTRAKYLNSIKNVDKHEGFTKFINDEDGFNKLGFTMLGENISYGYKLNGVHIIEWMYAGDEPHNKNQLDNRWNFVGIGVDGLATCLIFGTGKM